MDSRCIQQAVAVIGERIAIVPSGGAVVAHAPCFEKGLAGLHDSAVRNGFVSNEGGVIVTSN